MLSSKNKKTYVISHKLSATAIRYNWKFDYPIPAEEEATNLWNFSTINFTRYKLPNRISCKSSWKREGGLSLWNHSRKWGLLHR